MAMTLDQLKRSRATRRVIISKLLVELQDAVDNVNVLETERFLAQLELKEAALHSVTTQLEGLTTDDSELDRAIQENEAYSEQIIDSKVLAHRMLSAQRNASRTATTTATSQPYPSTVTKTVAKLPKLQIRKFDGSVQDWERFWDQFEAGVDSNPTLSKVDKFNYLKGFLTENASLTIAGLSLTAANYDIASDLLKKKYGQPEVLVAEHVRQLLEIRKVARIDNGQELRALMENFQTHLRALENLGKSVASMGTLLCPTLLKCLPNQIIREWHRKSQGQPNDDVMSLLSFLQMEIEGIELAARNSNLNQSPKEVKKSVKREDSTTSASTLLATSNESNSSSARKKKPWPCIFCTSDDHKAHVCPQFKSKEDRIRVLQSQNRCLRCMSQSHPTIQCRRSYPCVRCKSSRHHVLMCDRQFKSSSTTTSNATEQTMPKVVHTDSTVEVSKTLIASTVAKEKSRSVSVLQTIRVWIKHATGMHQIVLLLDGGSERTFINQDLARRLQLPIQQSESLTVHSFGGKRVTQASNRVTLNLVGNNDHVIDISALEVAEICNGVTLWENSQIEAYLRTHKLRYNWAQAMGSGETVSVDVLVGADWYWKIVTGHMKKIAPLLMAVETVFGWTLQGNASAASNNDHVVTMFAITETEGQPWLNNRIAELWELDRTGIMSLEEQSTQTLQEIEVLDYFQATTTFVNNRYQVRIPWNQEQSALCKNFGLAKQRLKGLLRHLQKNPELLERYRNGIYEYLQNGHTEVVEKDDQQGPIFFMPHHPIIKEDRKTTKLRIVFDASAHDSSGKSLNQCQFTGPNLNPTIFDLLLRFRWHRIGVTSDVEKAFLQIELQDGDRNATRFLWTNEKWEKDSDPELITFRMTRVLFGMKASPYLLAATIRHHLRLHAQEFPEVSAILDKNTYVDDVVTGSDNTHEALFISTQAKMLMDKASMPLKKWATNDVTLREHWVKLGLVLNEEPIELLKVLGMMWDPATDLLSFKTSELLKALATSQPTKRSILEILARIFDPLGILSPKLVTLKILLQDLWRLSLKWDDVITDDLQKIWNNWKEDLPLLQDFRMERWYQTSAHLAITTQLHIFCDASMRAYGAVAYLRICISPAEYITTFIVSKTRIAPLKLISIPRLELLACVLGARLAHSLLQAWSQEKMATFLWTDSQVVLSWIQSTPSKWKVFVARRIQEIQELTKVTSWNYCLSKENPADTLSRGQSLKMLFNNTLWWKGPTWLVLPEDEWKRLNLPADMLEVEQMPSEEFSVLVMVSKEPEVGIFEPTRYSTWQKIIRITAWIIRFLQNCHKTNVQKTAFLTIKELKNAELYWFKMLQKQLFPEEYQLLLNKKPLPNNSKLIPFQPFLDRAGIMKISGRLQFANISKTQAQPILLKGGGLVELFVLNRHEQVLHGGVQATLMKIREDVWLIKGRQVVRSSIHRCLKCRKWNAQPAAVIEAPLPEDRINRSYPFAITGLDFSGPIWTKSAGEKSKSYICLFTCAVTRSIHLELTQSQGIKHFLWALRRFVARRGGCTTIYSDNGATFVQADRLLQESLLELKHPDLQQWSVQQQIEWKFIPPRAPWWGGFYERLVGTVKRHLRRTLGTALMSPEELSTLLAEIESVINSRPLTALSEDVRDMHPLTPSHFLIGRQGGPLTDLLASINTVPVKPALLKKWRYRKRLMDNFWRQWSKEYLLQLQTAHRLAVPSRQVILKLGDVALLKEAKLPRGQWKLARIEEMYVGRDGQVRSLLLRTPEGTPLRRAVQHVCPLEVV